ncbi:MAG: serine/threonine protein kinase, partial [Anaerolineae bacterium]|nr:serine/threonine protein kinase [Anaerolineae bacterium]
MQNRKIGKYEVIERLGRGGMAEVYRAYQGTLDRYVAIKVLHAFLADDPEFKSRFEREAQNIAKLKHPNIVQVYDFDYDVEAESYYMVMELIDGSTLKDRLSSIVARGELLPIPEVIRIMRESASALAYAHSRNMIHRDVKPANLMLDHDNRVVLTDFGIAKIVTGAQFTASGGMVGTPAFMAPEQGLGEAGDERSDLYSLGIIMFQMLTGQLPYDAETPLAIILKHLNTPTPIARDVNPNVPEELDRIVRKVISKEAQDRYQSAGALIEDLDRFAHTNAEFDVQPRS